MQIIISHDYKDKWNLMFLFRNKKFADEEYIWYLWNTCTLLEIYSEAMWWWSRGCKFIEFSWVGNPSPRRIEIPSNTILIIRTEICLAQNAETFRIQNRYSVFKAENVETFCMQNRYPIFSNADGSFKLEGGGNQDKN